MNVGRTLSICIVNPRFEPSFWGHDFALPLLAGDKRCWTVTGALPALAGLTPSEHEVTLLDENVETIDFDRLRSYDVVGVTGMMVQGPRMREILAAVNGHGPVVAAGGPYVSVQPESFERLCDARFVGEAETTWPAFLSDLANGRPTLPVYRQPDRTDMTAVPPPRYDLLQTRHYVSAAVQFSRGCPFLCEFCDIITVFGRRPRTKTPAQLLIELDRVRLAGFRYCFLVDDNFIGNRNAAKALLRELAVWQKKHGYPLAFNTEASIDLADDAELIDLMVEANILQVFVGIESPRRESLEETRKHQNTRGDSMQEKIQRLRDGGLVITAGFIVGFDHDDPRIFDEQFQFIQHAGLAQAVVAVLCPIPTTPLYDRLRADGRLRPADPEIAFEPKQMSFAELQSGHRDLLLRLFEPAAYFGRLFHGYQNSAPFRRRRALLAATSGVRLEWSQRLRRAISAVGTALRLARAAGRAGCLQRLGPAYVRALRGNATLGKEAIPLHTFVTLCVLHWHYYNMVRHRRNTEFALVDTVDRKAEPLVPLA
jgi:radical SAM superfamily enzyme YgiQ (UPF0313 family)